MRNSTKSTNTNSLRNPKCLSMFNSLDVLESPEMVSEIIPALVAFLKPFNRNQIVSKIAACVMNQSNHKHTMRLDILIRLAIYNCTGSTPARQEQLKKILNTYIQKKGVHLLDDYPMYPFAETFMGRNHDVLLMNGSLCPSVRNAQYTYDALVTLNSPQITTYIDQVDNFILLINLINEQVGFTVDYETPVRMKEFVDIRFFRSPLISKTVLQKNGISVSNLKPFICDYNLKSSQLNQNVESNGLTIAPLLETEEEIIIAAPHNLAQSIKNFLLSSVYTEKITTDFQSAQAREEQMEMQSYKFRELENTQTEERYDCLIKQDSRCIGLRRYVLTFHIVESIENPTKVSPEHVKDRFERLTAYIDAKIRDFLKQRSLDDDYQQTQILIITSSNRIRTRLCNEIEQNNLCSIFVLHPDDIVICSRMFDLNVIDLWRYGKILNDLSSDGIVLQNTGTFLNLITFLVEHSKHQSHDESQYDSKPDFVDIGYELEKEIRDLNVSSRSLSTLQLPNKKRVRTERFVDSAEMTFDKSQFTAATPDSSLVGVRTDYTTLWLESIKPIDSSSEFEYFVWDTMHGILTYLSRFHYLGNIKCNTIEPILFKLIFTNDFPANEPSFLDSKDPFHLRADTKTRTIDVIVNRCWYTDTSIKRTGWSSKVVQEIINCLLELDPLKTPDREVIENLVEETSKYGFEFSNISDVRTEVDIMIEAKIFDPYIPVKPSATNLTRANRRNGSCLKDAYVNKANSTMLKDYSDQCLNELTSKIRKLEKSNLLEHCVRQHHNAVIEERRWQHSASPKSKILGKTVTENNYVEAYKRASATIRATSIIIEISIHEAGKLGDKEVDYMEFEDLMALAIELFKVSIDIDVERYKPNETNVYCGFDGSLNVTSQLRREGNPIIANQIKNSLELYDGSSTQEVRGSGNSNKAIQTAELEKAIVKEYGMTISKISMFLQGLLDIAIKKNVSLFKIRQSTLRSFMCDSKRFSQHEVDGVLDRLTVKGRQAFVSSDEVNSNRELVVSRFGRGQSLASRPIISLDSGLDPTYLISPLLLYRSLNYSLHGANGGSLKDNNFFISSEMVRFARKRSNDLSIEFNKEVAEEITMPGFKVRREVKMTEALKIDSSDDTKLLGSVDVIAVDQKNSRVWVIEAKNLQFCRTLGEVANILTDFRGDYKRRSNDKMKPDRLRRHLNRVDFLRKNKHKLASVYSINRDIEVNGLLVFRFPQVVGSREWEIGSDQESVSIDKLKDFLSTY